MGAAAQQLALADLGADVIKVEAPGRRAVAPTPGAADGPEEEIAPGLQPWNRQPLSNKLNRNRRGLALDLKAPEGRDIFLRLVDRADLVIENFSARVLPSLGLGQEVLAGRNPDLVRLAMPGFGLSGPYAPYVAYGPSTEPMTGLGALMARQRSGTGSMVELSQHEAGILCFGEYLVRRQLEGQEPHRPGNADPESAPSGVYRCAGEDSWIALAAVTEQQWQALAGLAGAGWRDDDRFASRAARIEHQEVIDAAVGAFTRQRDKFELMAALQGRRTRGAGAPALPGAADGRPGALMSSF